MKKRILLLAATCAIAGGVHLTAPATHAQASVDFACVSTSYFQAYFNQLPSEQACTPDPGT